MFTEGQKVRFIGGGDSGTFRSRPGVGAVGTVVTVVDANRVMVVFPEWPLDVPEGQKVITDIVFGHIPGYNRDAWPLTVDELESAEVAV